MLSGCCNWNSKSRSIRLAWLVLSYKVRRKANEEQGTCCPSPCYCLLLTFHYVLHGLASWSEKQFWPQTKVSGLACWPVYQKAVRLKMERDSVRWCLFHSPYLPQKCTHPVIHDQGYKENSATISSSGYSWTTAFQSRGWLYKVTSRPTLLKPLVWHQEHVVSRDQERLWRTNVELSWVLVEVNYQPKENIITLTFSAGVPAVYGASQLQTLRNLIDLVGSPHRLDSHES